MKKIMLLLVILMVFSLSAHWVELQNRNELFTDQSSGEDIIIDFCLDGYEMQEVRQNEKTYSRISYQFAGEYAEPGMPDLPCFSTLIAVPNTGRISLEVLTQQQETIPDILVYPRQSLQLESEIPRHDFIISEEYYTGGGLYPAAAVNMGEPAILRDYRVVRLTVNPFQYNASSKQLHISTNLSVRIVTEEEQGINELENNHLPSRAFSALYTGSIVNYDNMKREEEFQKPACLYIYINQPQVYAYLDYLLEWRRQQGYEVTAVSTSATGSTNINIQSYIEDAYNNWENPPEYVTLVGDANGSFNIPCFYEDNGETDNDYVMVAGNDILPDIAIGRIPFNSLSELGTIVTKVLNYETEPYMGNTNWFERGLMVGDPSTSGSSCVDSKMYVVQEMAVHAPAVDAIELYSGSFASQIDNNLNQGCIYYNYRGFGDFSGWGSSHINNLNNGEMLSSMVFLTCGSGSYASYSDALSEAFIKAGSATSPKGGVAAICTATNATHTTFNNTMDMGIWTGVFTDETWNMALGLTRGKLAIYNNYPNNPSNHQHQFISWNNLMGDAVMPLWSAAPQEFIVYCPQNVNLAQDMVAVIVQNTEGEPVNGAQVTFLDEADYSISAYSDENGYAWLELADLEQGTLHLTVQKHNFLPHRTELELTETEGWLEAECLIDDSSGNSNGQLNPGESISLEISLTNNSTQSLSDLSLTAICTNDNVIMTVTDTDFEDIAPDETVSGNQALELILPENITGLEKMQLYLEVSNGETTWNLIIEEEISAPCLYLSNYELDPSGSFDPGDDADITVYLQNIGITAANGVNIELTCDDNRISITDATSFLGQIPAGSTGNNFSNPFHVIAQANIIPGTQIIFQINVTTPELQHPPLFFTLTLGETGTNDPLGPDTYGYYCYDESDAAYLDCPEYNWIEIDPDNGGAGTVLALYDNGNTGDVVTIDLPISFVFYGNIYDEISVCSNGWLAPGGTENRDYMNSTLPGPGGPSPMIAVYWDDLRTDYNSNVCYFYDAEQQLFIVEWSQMRNDWDDSIQTFQVILYDAYQYPNNTGDSNIKMQYNEFSNPNAGSYGGFYVYHGQFVTVGIEDHTTLRGLEYTYNYDYPPQAETLDDETAIFFTTSPIEMEEAYLTIFEEEILDSGEDGEIDYGEEVEIRYSISNLGENTAADVYTLLELQDDYVSVIQDSISYPDINGNENVFPASGFILQISDQCPDDYEIILPVTIYYNQTSFQQLRQITVNAPLLEGGNFFIFNDDNNDQLIDAGEEFDLGLVINNLGGSAVYQPQPELISISPYLTVNSAYNEILQIQNDASSYLVYRVQASEDLIPGEDLPVSLLITGGLNFTAELAYSLNAGILLDGFESEDFSYLPWAMGGANIFQISDISHSGSYSAQSGDIGDNQFIWLGLDMLFNTDGEVTFWLKVSTEEGWDFVKFYIDNQMMDSWSGITGWFQQSFPITAGQHELIWEYEKDVIFSGGDDCFWIDDVSIPGSPDNLPQVLLTDKAQINFELSGSQTATEMIRIFNFDLEETIFNSSFEGEDTSWLSIQPASGNIAGADTTQMFLQCDPTGLVSGEHTANLVISNNQNYALNIPVTLNYDATYGDDAEVLTKTVYKGNYPNPFNPSTTFSFHLIKEQQVELSIYNLKGQKVKTIVNDFLPAGNYNLEWLGIDEAGKQLASGIYFSRFKTQDVIKDSKLLLLK